jgi:hypothetical protein
MWFSETEYDIDEYIALWNAATVNTDEFTAKFEVNAKEKSCVCTYFCLSFIFLV